MPSLFVGYHSNIAIVCAKFNALRPLLCCLPFIIILFSIFHTFLFTDFYYIFTLLTYIFVHLLFNRNKINREKSSSRTHIGIGWMWEVNRHTHTQEELTLAFVRINAYNLIFLFLSCRRMLAQTWHCVLVVLDAGWCRRCIVEPFKFTNNAAKIIQ